MTIEKLEDITLIKCTENTVSEFFIVIKEKYSNFEGANLIIDFSDLKGVNSEDILLFSKLSEKHKEAGTSFVIVVNGIDFNSLPDEITTGPTIQEAHDIIEMEKIERDLGLYRTKIAYAKKTTIYFYCYTLNSCFFTASGA